MLKRIGNWLCNITPIKNNWKQFGDWRYRLGIFLIHYLKTTKEDKKR